MEDLVIDYFRWRQADATRNALQEGINFAQLPGWQTKGVGLFHEQIEKSGLNPKTGKVTKTTRQKLRIEWELPTQETYADFLRTHAKLPHHELEHGRNREKWQ